MENENGTLVPMLPDLTGFRPNAWQSSIDLQIERKVANVYYLDVKYSMCEELEEELERGKTAARNLVDHFENMGEPTKCSIPIETDDGCYIVQVRKTF